jgi:hypothetical protein
MDLLAAEGILIACYAWWRYFQQPAGSRLIAASSAMAMALLIKHTCIILLPAAMLYGVLFWRRSKRHPTEVEKAKPPISAVAAVLLVPLFLWAFTLFDFSKPRDHCLVVRAAYSEHWSFAVDVVNANLARHWPAGIYIASIMDGIVHAGEGHFAYLLGESSTHGWWYYHLVASMLKVPIGILAFLAIGLLSFVWKKIRFEELGLIVPVALYLLLLMTTRINIGFRHALPAYIMLIMLASRALGDAGRKLPSLCWFAIIASALHVLMWHPDYLSYVNPPWKHPARIISDSNIDWGQSLKQVRTWIDSHPHDGRPVYIGYFGGEAGPAVQYYLGDRVQRLWSDPPEHGLLIVSPVLIWGAYAPPERFAALRDREPIAIIGHSMRVYDLDRR